MKHFQLTKSTLLLGCFACMSAVATADTMVEVGNPTFLFLPPEMFQISEISNSVNYGYNRAPMPVAGTLKQLTMRPSEQPWAGSTVTACVLLNGLVTDLCVSYAAAEWPATRQDTQHKVAVVPGDVVSVRFTNTGGSGDPTHWQTSFVMSPTETAEQVFRQGFESPPRTDAVLFTDGVSMSNDASPFFNMGKGGCSGRDRPDTFERCNLALPFAGVAKNLYLIPDRPPQAGAPLHACVAVNGVLTSLCVDYTVADWPYAKLGSNNPVAVNQGDLISVGFTSLSDPASGYARASLAIGGVSSSGVPSINSSFYQPVAFPASFNNYVGQFLVPRAGLLRNLFLTLDEQPTAASQLNACIAINGVDTTLCSGYAWAGWPAASGNVVDSVAVNVGDIVSVHFTSASFPWGAPRASYQFD